jgi:hypothetical protein
MPFEQLRPLPQAWPHAPQFAGSFATFVQLPLHELCPLAQVEPSGPASPGLPALPADPPSGWVEVGLHVMSWPQTPTELRPQLAPASAKKSSSRAARKVAETEDGRWKRILETLQSKSRVAARPESKEHAS